MKPVYLAFWVSEQAPDLPTGDYGKVTPQALADYIASLGDRAGELRVVTDTQIAERAHHLAANEYRDTVASIVENLKDEIKAGNITDADGAEEWLTETIDGHHDVIYTACAQEVLRHSSNDGAYFEEFGSEGAITDDGIEWSKLAYMALLADVREEIGDLDDLFAEPEEDGDDRDEDE